MVLSCLRLRVNLLFPVGFLTRKTGDKYWFLEVLHFSKTPFFSRFLTSCNNPFSITRLCYIFLKWFSMEWNLIALNPWKVLFFVTAFQLERNKAKWPAIPTWFTNFSFVTCLSQMFNVKALIEAFFEFGFVGGNAPCVEISSPDLTEP